MLHIVTVALIVLAATLPVTHATLFKIKNIALSHLNKDYVDGHLFVAKVDRTNVGLSGNLTVLKDWPSDLKYSADLFAEFSNSYRRMPYNVNGLYCQLLLNIVNVGVMEKITEVSNFTSVCPMKKGYYYIDKLTLREVETPDFPWDTIMFDFNITLQNDVLMFRAQLYLIIEHDQMFINKFLKI